jgi:hypothetical protein
MFNFPDAPTLNQQVIGQDGEAYIWDATKWKATPSVGTPLVYLPLTGGTLQGPLILNADPTAALGAATKQYIDNNFVGLHGATGSGPVIFSGGVPVMNLVASSAQQGMLTLTSDPGQPNVLRGQRSSTGTPARWDIVLGDATAETGTPVNTGANLDIIAYSDTGTQLSTPLSINRATGQVTLTANMSVNAPVQPAVIVRDTTAPPLAAGIYCNGTGIPLAFGQFDANDNMVADFGHFDAGGDLFVNGGLTVGGRGILYTNYSATHWHAFNYDGTWVNMFVDGQDVGHVATVEWANSTFAQLSNLSRDYLSVVNGNALYVQLLGSVMQGPLQLATVGFNNTAPIAKPTISGACAGNTAIKALLTALAAYGLVNDTTTV